MPALRLLLNKALLQGMRPQLTQLPIYLLLLSRLPLAGFDWRMLPALITIPWGALQFPREPVPASVVLLVPSVLLVQWVVPSEGAVGMPWESRKVAMMPWVAMLELP